MSKSLVVLGSILAGLYGTYLLGKKSNEKKKESNVEPAEPSERTSFNDDQESSTQAPTDDYTYDYTYKTMTDARSTKNQSIMNGLDE